MVSDRPHLALLLTMVYFLPGVVALVPPPAPTTAPAPASTNIKVTNCDLVNPLPGDNTQFDFALDIFNAGDTCFRDPKVHDREQFHGLLNGKGGFPFCALVPKAFNDKVNVLRFTTGSWELHMLDEPMSQLLNPFTKQSKLKVTPFPDANCKGGGSNPRKL